MAVYLARLETPQKLALFVINGEPVYEDCAECGAREPVIVGMFVGDDGKVAVIPSEPNGIPFRNAVYCRECFERLEVEHRARCRETEQED